MTHVSSSRLTIIPGSQCLGFDVGARTLSSSFGCSHSHLQTGCTLQRQEQKGEEGNETTSHQTQSTLSSTGHHLNGTLFAMPFETQIKARSVECDAALCSDPICYLHLETPSDYATRPTYSVAVISRVLQAPTRQGRAS